MRRHFRNHTEVVINKSGHLFVGVMLMVIGCLFLLDTMNIVDTGEIISGGWPLIIIALGLIKMTRADSTEERLSAGIWLFIGAFRRWSPALFSVWGLIWPTALIAFGFYLVVRSRARLQCSRRLGVALQLHGLYGRDRTQSDFTGIRRR